MLATNLLYLIMLKFGHLPRSACTFAEICKLQNFEMLILPRCMLIICIDSKICITICIYLQSQVLQINIPMHCSAQRDAESNDQLCFTHLLDLSSTIFFSGYSALYL
jgi:hypothetical protein